MALLRDCDRQFKTPEDIVAHVGDEYAAQNGAITPPIYQSSLFVYPNECNGVQPSGYSYSRAANPTVEVAERKIAALEKADGALCFASGMAAISSAMLHFVRANCHILMISSAYGPARGFAEHYLGSRLGCKTTFVLGNDVSEIEDAIQENTRLIYLESPSSGVFRMQDLEKIAALAKSRGIGTVIDGTYATPLHQNPLSWGIDIVCHTASKYMGGHSDIVAGALAARKDIIESIRGQERELLGGIMDPHQAFLLIRGLRTLPQRLKQHGENGSKIATFLENHPRVERVFYPGSKTYQDQALFAKYLTGTNGLMSFVPKGTPEQIRHMVASLRFFQNGCSWGGFESLALCYTVGMTDESAEAIGAVPNLVRIHVGLETPETLMEDLDSALNAM